MYQPLNAIVETCQNSVLEPQAKQRFNEIPKTDNPPKCRPVVI